VTFWTDIFHPLITPLNTYTYTTDIQDNGTVSATDEERLPPGGFSLRHGFQDWFGRGKRSMSSSRQASGGQQQQQQQTPLPPRHATQTPPPPTGRLSNVTTPDSKTSPAGATTANSLPSYMQTSRRDVSTYEVLRYIRSTFDEETVLNSVPLEAAGNPGAWHAWRAHQRQTGKLLPGNGAAAQAWHDGLSDGEDKKPQQSAIASATGGTKASSTPVARQPGEWNWEGVWEDRVQKGIAASLSEAVLYGGAGASDDVVSYFTSQLSPAASGIPAHD
jgi:hypothetical protein